MLYYILFYLKLVYDFMAKVIKIAFGRWSTELKIERTI